MNKHSDITELKANAEARPRPRRGRALVHVLLVALLLAGGFLGYRFIMALAPEPKVRPQLATPLPVRVMPVELTDMRPRWTFYGEAAPERRSTLQVPVSGRIVWTSPSWRAGARVSRGEALLRIEDLDYRAAAAEARAALAEGEASLAEARQKVASEQRLLRQAEEQLAVARRDFERTRRLVNRGTVAKTQLDQKRTSLLQAQEKVEQRRHALTAAQAALARAQTTVERLKWALKRAEDNLAKTTLTAPYDGQLGNVQAQVGQQAQPGTPLAELVSAGPVEIRFTVPEAHLLQLRRAGEPVVGRKVRIVWRGGAGARQVVIPARIARFGAQVERNRGEVELYATPEDPKQAAWLLPGAFVEVRMGGPLLKGVALLPEAALQDTQTVFVVDGGKLARRNVRLLGMEADKAIVDGLKAGEQVVRHRLAAPRPGQPVKILGSSG